LKGLGLLWPGRESYETWARCPLATQGKERNLGRVEMKTHQRKQPRATGFNVNIPVYKGDGGNYTLRHSDAAEGRRRGSFSFLGFGERDRGTKGRRWRGGRTKKTFVSSETAGGRREKRAKKVREIGWEGRSLDCHPRGIRGHLKFSGWTTVKKTKQLKREIKQGRQEGERETRN